MAKKSCKRGYYYCYASSKCKKIPMGYFVGMGGWLRKEKGDDSDEETKNNGNGGNGNGNHSNGNGNGDGSSSDGGGESGGGGVSEEWSAKYKKSIDCDNPKGFSQKSHCRGRKKVNEEKKDHEYSMARSELKTIKNAASRLEKKMGKKGEGELKAWVQSKITKAADYIDTAADYVTNEETIAEKRDGKSAKDKGYSLKDWFKGGGWVQAGGKYDGKPCAKQPGQKTKPFCRDADDRANMSKKERSRRAAKKRREDPNANRTGKANMVSASYSNWKQDLNQLDEVAPLVYAAGAAALAAPYLIKKFVKPKVDKMLDGTTKTKPLSNSTSKPSSLQQAQQNARDIGKMTGTSGLMNKTINTSDKIQTRYDRLRDAMRQSGMKGADQNMNMRGVMMKNSYQPEGGLVDEGNIGYSNPSINGKPILDRKGKPVSFNKAETEDMNRYRRASKKAGRKIYADEPLPEETEIVDEGKKDACYHKVKSRYSVWPSAYASGALVKCRKKGAKNWGNKTKNESYEFSNWRDDFQATEVESVDLISNEPLQPTQGLGSDMLDEKKDIPSDVKNIAKELDKAGISEENINEKCWKGYTKKGMKTMFGKRYPNCVKKEEVEIQEAIPEYGKYDSAMDKIRKKSFTGRELINALKTAAKLRPTEKKVVSEDWQKSNRKDGVDGMSQKSVNAYKSENPGSKLQTAVTGKNPKGKDKKRRKSFCARSKGQKDMHNIDCSKTPDKKICKARKRWRC